MIETTKAVKTLMETAARETVLLDWYTEGDAFNEAVKSIDEVEVKVQKAAADFKMYQ